VYKTVTLIILFYCKHRYQTHIQTHIYVKIVCVLFKEEKKITKKRKHCFNGNLLSDDDKKIKHSILIKYTILQ